MRVTVEVERNPAAGSSETATSVALREQGDAFHRFFETYASRLRGLLFHIGARSEAVDDIVQETLIRAYDAGLHEEEIGSEHWPWLATVARNLAIDTQRRCRVRGEHSLDDDTVPEPAVTVSDIVGDPESFVIATDRRGDVARALRLVDARHRRLLVLKHVRGLKYEEIAESEGISLDALKSVLARARESFRHAYEAVVERQGVRVLFPPVFAPLARRFRSLRTKLSSNDGVVGMVGQGVATVPGLANAVATIAVLGGLALGGAMFDAAPTVPASSSSDPVQVSSLPDTAGYHELALEPDPASEPVEPSVVMEPDPVGTLASSPPESPSAPAETPPPEASVEVDSDEVVPMDDPPASAKTGGGVSSDDDVTKADVNAAVDTIEDEQDDVALASSFFVSCTSSEKQGTAMKTVCPALQEADELV